MAELIRSLSQQEQLNFLLTNRIPRRLATRLMGWFSGIESRALTRLSVAIWQLFADDLKLDEARKSEFTSLQDCFTRELRPGSRTVDPRDEIVVSPCDAIVGACGTMAGTTLFQAKGFPYTLQDLLGDDEMVDKHRDGLFVTLRLRSDMYHRFHAPEDCRVRRVNYISGDTWNVNPIALRRIEKLFCKNERAVIDLELADRNEAITLVPVAAILVASIKLHCLDHLLSLRYRGSNRLECDATYRRGDEMGYFQHGSTIVLFATGGFEIDPRVTEGTTIRMGTPLLCRVGLPRRAGMDHSNREDR